MAASDSAALFSRSSPCLGLGADKMVPARSGRFPIAARVRWDRDWLEGTCGVCKGANDGSGGEASG